jgi:hypothetical protein
MGCGKQRGGRRILIGVGVGIGIEIQKGHAEGYIVLKKDNF